MKGNPSLYSSQDIEINSVAYDTLDSKLYFGGSSKDIHIYDLESESIQINSFKGHTNYIHSLLFLNPLSPQSSYLVSASEDTTMRLWDPKSFRVSHIFDSTGKSLSISKPIPSTSSAPILSLASDPENPSWIASGDSRGRISLWYLPSLSLMKEISIDQSPRPIYSLLFYQSNIISGHENGGSSQSTSRLWKRNGELLSTSNSSFSTSIFSIGVNENSIHNRNKIIVSCGNSGQIDVETEFGHRSLFFRFTW